MITLQNNVGIQAVALFTSNRGSFSKCLCKVLGYIACLERFLGFYELRILSM